MVRPAGKSKLTPFYFQIDTALEKDLLLMLRAFLRSCRSPATQVKKVFCGIISAKNVKKYMTLLSDVLKHFRGSRHKSIGCMSELFGKMVEE
jgi:hypothetical protein